MKLSEKTVFVTGERRFIGSRLVKTPVNRGARVKVLKQYTIR